MKYWVRGGKVVINIRWNIQENDRVSAHCALKEVLERKDKSCKA